MSKYEVGGTITTPGDFKAAIIAIEDRLFTLSWGTNGIADYTMARLEHLVDIGYRYTPPLNSARITNSHTCTCEMRDLMMRGCKCGYLEVQHA